MINYNFIINNIANNFFNFSMKWHYSFTKKYTIMNYSKLLKNLKKELIRYPIARDNKKKTN